jgi:hypothetical protein
MNSAPVSQYPLPPAFFATPAQPPKIPDKIADVHIFGGTTPMMPLAAEQEDNNYGEKIKRFLFLSF